MYLGIITLPLIGGIITGVLGRHIGRRGGIWINVQSIIASTILSIVGYYEIAITGWSISIIIGQWIETGYLGVAWGINIDTLSISIYMPVLIVSSCVQIFSIDYMSSDGYNIRFYTYLSLFTFFMLVLISGDSMITIFIGWEGVGVCSYLLVGYWYKRIKANKAGMQALIVNRVGDWGITIGIITIWGIIGDLDQASILSLGSRIKTEWVTIITIWVLIGAMAKSAQLGLHVWLPSAMEGPTPVSALIHAATMVTAGVYLLIRLSPLLEYSSTGLIIISWLGALTAIIAGTIAVYQNDLKRVIAYSTMSQLGYMVLAIGGSQYGISAYHMVNHAYFKALLFLSAGAVIHSWSDEQDQRRYGGLINLIPLTYTCILIGSMSLIAAPYLTGNYSKEMILEAAYGQYKSEGIIGFWLGAITAGITSFYSFKLIYWTFISRPNGQRSNNIGVNDPSNTIIIPLCILSVLSIVHGYWAKDGLIGLGSTIWAGSIWIKPENQTMIEGEFGGIEIKMTPMIISIIMIIIGVRIYMGSRVGGVVVSKRIKRLLIGKYHMENIYNSIIVSGVLGVSSKTGKNLDKGIMEIIGASGVKRVVGVEGEALGCLDSGYIPHLAINIIIGLIMALSLGEGIIGVEDIMMIIILKISINK